MLPVFSDTAIYILVALYAIIAIQLGLAAWLWSLHTTQDHMDMALAKYFQYVEDRFKGHDNHLWKFEERYTETLSAASDQDKRLREIDQKLTELIEVVDDTLGVLVRWRSSGD